MIEGSEVLKTKKMGQESDIALVVVCVVCAFFGIDIADVILCCVSVVYIFWLVTRSETMFEVSKDGRDDDDTFDTEESYNTDNPRPLHVRLDVRSEGRRSRVRYPMARSSVKGKEPRHRRAHGWDLRTARDSNDEGESADGEMDRDREGSDKLRRRLRWRHQGVILFRCVTPLLGFGGECLCPQTTLASCTCKSWHVVIILRCTATRSISLHFQRSSISCL